MGKKNRNFTVETEGHCFLCSNQILSGVKPSMNPSHSESSSNTYSLHCLSQYLRMDMRKMFVDNDDIPPHLLEEVASSELKVELCNECVFINDSISKRWRQLEKVNMELSSLVNLTLGNLDKVGLFERLEGTNPTLSDRELGSLSLEKLKIVQALRKEAKIKCSAKLQSNRPKVCIPNLTREEVNRKKFKIKNMQKCKLEMQPERSFVEEKSPGTNFMTDDYNEDFEASYKELPRTEGSGTPIPMDNSIPDITSDENPIKSDNHKTGTVLKMTGKATSKDGINANIASPLIVAGIPGLPDWKEQFNINPETGKCKCKVCSKEFANQKAIRVHYESIHLQMKYKCKLCGREFPYNNLTSYSNHYLAVHIGVRFKCNVCNKLFKQKLGLDKHMITAHLGKRFECQFCSRTFSQSSNRTKHIKKHCSVSRAAKQGNSINIDSC